MVRARSNCCGKNFIRQKSLLLVSFRRKYFVQAAFLMVLSAMLSACVPSLAPKYGDYRLDLGPPTNEESNLHFSEDEQSEADEDATANPDSVVASLTVEHSASSGPATEYEMLNQVRQVLEDSGWILRPADVENAVATEPRKFANWLFYSVHAELEVVVIGGKYVRLFIHPWRRYMWGSWGRIPYLKSGLAIAVFESVDSAFQDAGYEFIGNAQMRDRENRSEESPH